MYTISDLFDLDHTLAKDYLSGFTYPWEALKGIKDFILALGPTLGEDYEDYAVPADSPADFAVRIAGDSMAPLLADGEIALVRRSPIEDGDVGLFFVDGDMKCKQYVRDSYGGVYLLSLNRARADADVRIPPSSGVTLCCFGKVLLERKPPVG